jgi:NADPH:quinone reductase-like Zn-dependent oxidoreductase
MAVPETIIPIRYPKGNRSVCGKRDPRIREHGGKTVRAMMIETFGRPEVPHPSYVHLPEPADSEALIEIAYAVVNPDDRKIRERMPSGRFPHKFPVILGWDTAGTVRAVGKYVMWFPLGGRVYAYCRNPKVQFGTVRPPALVEIRL